jgi:hypothetical protein
MLHYLTCSVVGQSVAIAAVAASLLFYVVRYFVKKKPVCLKSGISSRRTYYYTSAEIKDIRSSLIKDTRSKLDEEVMTDNIQVDSAPNGGLLAKGMARFRKRLEENEAKRKKGLQAFCEKLKFWKKTEVDKDDNASTPKASDCCHCHKLCDYHALAAQISRPPPTLKLLIRHRPVIYHVQYDDVIKVRGKLGVFSRQAVLHNRQYGFSYRSEVDLLRRDWELALERHSEQHPMTYNNSLWTTTSTARKRLEQNRQPQSRWRKLRPVVKCRLQRLRIEKEYSNQPYRRCYYTLVRKSDLRMDPQGPVRRRVDALSRGTAGRSYTHHRSQMGHRQSSIIHPTFRQSLRIPNYITPRRENLSF